MTGLIALSLIAAALLVGCVLLFPRWLYPSPSAAELNGAKLVGKQRLDVINERLKLQNDARTTLLQGLGGAVLLLGAYFTYRQIRISQEQLLQTATDNDRQQKISNDQLLHNIKANHQQLHVIHQGQITERFTRAIDQLGSESKDVQLGGIYALQQISRSSSEESSAIYEILAAYARIHSPFKGQHVIGPIDFEAIPRLREREPGVQAAMLVLGRRVAGSTAAPLDLMGTNLQRLRLSATYVPDGANLENVLFWRSSMINASLGGASLRKAKLGWTDLQHSSLVGADLQGADLRKAMLGWANLRDADLSYARLEAADLRSADLRGCNLREAKDLEHVNLTDSKADDKTKWPDAFDFQAAGVTVDSRSLGHSEDPVQ